MKRLLLFAVPWLWPRPPCRPGCACAPGGAAFHESSCPAGGRGQGCGPRHQPSPSPWKRRSPKDWHTYWKNPGDAGAATEIAWTLPPGWTADAIQWPRPKRLPVGPLMDYGYEGTPWLLTRITAPADTSGTGNDQGACHLAGVQADMHSRGEHDLSIDVPVGPAAPDPAVAKDFAAARALLPVASPWKVTYALAGTTLDHLCRRAVAGRRRIRRRRISFPLIAGLDPQRRNRSLWAMPRMAWCCA